MASAPVSDTWERGDPYEQYVGRWSRQVAPRFLSWLNIPPRGAGWMSDAAPERSARRSWTAVRLRRWRASSLRKVFSQKAKDQLADRVLLSRGNAEQIPLEDGAVDVAVSGLVLNFVPDARAALREMARVTGPGGTIAAYVWDYSGKMEMMRHFWDAAVEIDPAAAKADEGARFPLCRPDALAELFTGAGLGGVEVTSIDITTAFASFDEYWRPFLGGQGPAPAYAMALDEKARTDLRDRIRARLPLRADGSLSLIARAWAVRGAVAG